MRLLFVSNLYPPNVVGGYERLCFDVATALVRRGHTVSVLTSSFGEARAEFPGQSVHRVLRLLIGDGVYAPFAGTTADRAAINRDNIAALHRVVSEERPDLVFAWNLFFFDCSLLEALAGLQLPVVAMLTDNWLIAMERPEFLAGFFRGHVFGDEAFAPRSRLGLLARGRAWLRPRTPRADTQLIRFPMGAIFGSGFVRDLYAASGIHFDRARIVHNGVVQKNHAPTAFRDRSQLLASGEVRLLFAGRLVDLKGAHTAVEAMALLDPSELGVERVQLTIVGDTQDAAYLRQLHAAIDRSGRATQITMQLPVAEDALFDLFQAHDLYLFPSLYEPFSLTLIHALAAGIPTIASCAGGNVEIIRDRKSGLLFAKGSAADLARAIRVLVRDDQLRARVAASGREVAAGFTFDTMVGQMERVLQAPS